MSRIGTITFLFILPLAVQASPTVYIPLGSANEVIAVDGATNKITATYTGVENPHGLVATPDGEYLIAGSLVETPLPADAKQGAPTSKLYVIHPAHGHVMLTVPVVGWTHHVAITPDGRYVLSTHATRGYVTVLDRIDNRIIQTIDTGPAPNYTAVTRDGRRAFVSNSGNGTISEIDLKAWKVVRTLDGGPMPEHMVLSRDEQTIYVTNPNAGTVSAVVVATGKIGRTFRVGADVHGLDISDDGKAFFASSKKDNKLVAIDIASGKERSLTLSPSPYHLNTIHGVGKIYVSSNKEPVIWVVDQSSLRLLDKIRLPKGEGHQMAIVP